MLDLLFYLKISLLSDIKCQGDSVFFSADTCSNKIAFFIFFQGWQSKFERNLQYLVTILESHMRYETITSAGFLFPPSKSCVISVHSSDDLQYPAIMSYPPSSKYLLASLINLSKAEKHLNNVHINFITLN